MKSLEELKKIKEEALKKMDLRSQKERGKIVVAMGTCGIAAGAKETLKTIIEELSRLQIIDIMVTQSGCMGLCDREPTISVELKGEIPVIYGDVNEINAKRIIKEHIIGGKVVEDLVIKRETV